MGLSKYKGNLAEAKVLTFLVKQCCNVALPWSEDSRYDLIAEKNARFIRIQVKYVSPRNGCLYIPLRSSNNWSVIKYKKEDVDLIAAYNPENDKIYFVPLSDFRNTATINLRIKRTKNNQKSNVVLAKRFENKFVI